MCTPPLISQDIHRFCLVYTTTCTFSTYYMNVVRITLILFSHYGLVISNNVKSCKNFHATLMLYRQLYSNSFNAFLVQYLQYLFFLSEFDCVPFLMLNYHKNVTACLLHNCLTFIYIVIFPDPNVIMNMSPFQLSLTYGSCCHHWFRSVIHYVNCIHFISKRHHIYKDKTDDNRFYYLMDHSLTDPLTTIFFFKPRQTITVTCMPVSMTFNNELPYTNITDDSLSGELLPENNLHEGQNLALDIVLDTDHIDYSALGNIDPDLNILFDNNTMNCKYFTEMEFNNYFTTSDNFSLFNLNIRSLPKNVVNLQYF